MRFDLNAGVAAAEQAMEPWDFVLAIDGVDYPTRPLATFELGVLKRLATISPEEQKAFFAGLFADPKPDVSRWEDDRLGAAAVAIVTYFGERTKKKSHHLQKQVQAALR